MSASRSVVALFSLLASGSAFSQTAALIPISIGPAAPGQCVIGSEGCGLPLGSAMDPLTEDSLVGLGRQAVPTIELPGAEKKAPAFAAKAPVEPATLESAADLVAIGGKIINPLAGTPFRGAAAASPDAAAPARQATFDTHIDGSGIEAAPVANASGLSYTRTQQVEASLGGTGKAFSGDPKLSAGDANLAPASSTDPR